jgi:hypothetical protein
VLAKFQAVERHGPQVTHTYGPGQESGHAVVDDAPRCAHAVPTMDRTEEKKLRLTAEEKRIMDDAMRVLGTAWSSWARSLLLPAAREALAKVGAR